MKLTRQYLEGHFLALCRAYALLMACTLSLVLASGSSHANDSDYYAGIKTGSYGTDASDWEFFTLIWGVYAGYRVSDYLALEAEYIDLDFEDEDDENFSGEIYSASVVPTLPLSDRWNAYAKLGWAWTNGEARQPGLRKLFRNGDDYFWGVGMNWNHGRLQLGGELQAADNFGDFDILSFRIGYNF